MFFSKNQESTKKDCSALFSGLKLDFITDIILLSMGVKLQDIIIRKTISLQDLIGTIILLHFKKLISNKIGEFQIKN